MSLMRRARGIEHEYTLNTDPPLGLGANVQRRRLIATAIEGLRQAGFLFPHVTWAVSGEEGNFEYENSLYSLWPLETTPPSVGKNGMRIYDDALHLEISTPVYATPEDAVIYAKVAEYLAFVAAQEARSSIDRQVYSYTSNISLRHSERGGYEAVACGTHGNITVSRRAFNASKIKEAQKALLPYLVTRIILCGGGGYIPYTLDERGQRTTKFEEPSSKLVGEDICFVISPRSHFVNFIASVDTTLKRGLLNLRDEPHANRDLYWRFHDINWECIRSDLQIYVRDILHGFVIAAFELGYLPDAPILLNPLGDLKRISMDTNLDWKVKLINGRMVDAVQDILIGYYLQKIETMLEKEKAPSEDWAAFRLLSGILNIISERKLTSLVYCLDWVTKLFLVEACDSPKEGLAACNQFTLIDQSILEYKGESTTALGDSLFEPNVAISALVKLVPKLTLEGLKGAIKRAIFEPPRYTRERERVQWLIERSKAKVKASWAFVIDENGIEKWLPEPLEG